MKKVFSIILLICSVQLWANNEQPKLLKGTYQRIDASYVFGAQLYNDNFLYNPGYSFQLTHGFKVHDDVNLGLGTGYLSLENERFIPFHFEVLGYKKKKKNAPFVKFQLGYSIGWNQATTSMDGYKMRGGVYFNAGLGRRIELNDKFSVLFHWSYVHQSASMEYEVFGGYEYEEELNYDMILLSVGILIHQ